MYKIFKVIFKKTAWYQSLIWRLFHLLLSLHYQLFLELCKFTSSSFLAFIAGIFWPNRAPKSSLALEKSNDQIPGPNRSQIAINADKDKEKRRPFGTPSQKQFLALLPNINAGNSPRRGLRSKLKNPATIGYWFIGIIGYLKKIHLFQTTNTILVQFKPFWVPFVSVWTFFWPIHTLLDRFFPVQVFRFRFTH